MMCDLKGKFKDGELKLKKRLTVSKTEREGRELMRTRKEEN